MYTIEQLLQQNILFLRDYYNYLNNDPVNSKIYFTDYSIINQPMHGKLTRYNTVSWYKVKHYWLYEPDPYYLGTDSILFQSEQVRSDIVQQQFHLDIKDISFNQYYNLFFTPKSSGFSNKNIIENLPLYNNESHRNRTITYHIVTQPKYGTVSLNGREFIYKKTEPILSGEDLFTYKLNDGIKDSKSYTYKIILNDPRPTVSNKTTNTPQNRSVTVPLSISSPNSSPYTYSIKTNPLYGKAKIVGSNLIYTPNYMFKGIDTFTYKGSDSEFESSNQATITVTVDALEKLSPQTLLLDMDKHYIFKSTRLEAENINSNLSVLNEEKFSNSLGVVLNNKLNYDVQNIQKGKFDLTIRYKNNSINNRSLNIYKNNILLNTIVLDLNTIKNLSLQNIDLDNNDTLNFKIANETNDILIDYIELFKKEHTINNLIIQNQELQLETTDYITIQIPSSTPCIWDSSKSISDKKLKIDLNSTLNINNTIEIKDLKTICTSSGSSPSKLLLYLNDDDKYITSKKVFFTPKLFTTMGDIYLNQNTSTLLPPLTIQDTIPNRVQKNRGLRVKINKDVPIVWDTTIDTLNISGSSKNTISTEVTYTQDKKEMILELKEDFYFASHVVLNGMKVISSQDFLLENLIITDNLGQFIMEIQR